MDATMPMACSTSPFRKTVAALCPRFARGLTGGVERPTGGDLVEQGEAEDRAAAHQRHPAEPGMEDEAGEQEDRYPGQIAERQHAGAGQELPQDVHVAQRRIVLRAGPEQGAAMGGIEDRRGDFLIEHHTAAHQEAGAQHLQHRVDGQAERSDQRDPRQGRLTPAGYHAVVDLEHVERADEQQQIDEEPEHHGGRQDRPERAQADGQCRLQRRIAHSALFLRSIGTIGDSQWLRFPCCSRQ
ncbi:MAG: hypothetical protein PGN33_11110 [Methylobacterium radiotolerans]